MSPRLNACCSPHLARTRPITRSVWRGLSPAGTRSSSFRQAIMAGITGFRHGLGVYQQICNVTPDLSNFAKAMANGYPIAALVGKGEFMDRFGPGGGVVFAGTYNGHPVGVAAALATIAELEDGSVHKHCFALARQVGYGLQQICDALGIPLNVVVFGSVFVPYFMQGPVESYTDLLSNDTRRAVWFRRTMS